MKIDKTQVLVSWMQRIKEDDDIFTRQFFSTKEIYKLYCNTTIEDDGSSHLINFSSFSRLLHSICRNKKYANLKKRVLSRGGINGDINKRRTQFIMINDNELDVKMEDINVYISWRNKKI